MQRRTARLNESAGRNSVARHCFTGWMMELFKSFFFQPAGRAKYAEWRQTWHRIFHAKLQKKQARVVAFRALSEKESTPSALLVGVVRPRKRVMTNQSARLAKPRKELHLNSNDRHKQFQPAMHAEMEACASAFRFCFGRASGDFSGHLGIRRTLIRLLLQSSV